MTYIRNSIELAAIETETHLERVHDIEAKNIREKVECRFASISSGAPLWERLKSHCGFECQNGWELIKGYPHKAPIFLIFDPWQEASVFRIKSFSQLVKLLANCPGFVFYVVDEDLTFILSFNDHDFLIGAGEAEKWVQQISNREPPC